MFKIKIIHRPKGLLNNIAFRSVETGSYYILKHIEERLYKVYDINDNNIDLNDSRGRWKERDIIEKFEKGKWVKIKN